MPFYNYIGGRHMDNKLCCITSTGGESQFHISILETGWIYDVFLILANEEKSEYEDDEIIKVKLKYSGKETRNDMTYSIFHTFYRFEHTSDFMIAFFIYSINNVTYATEHMHFAVED